MSKDYPWGKGTPKWTRDANANDSDKSFTVPTGKVWDMKLIRMRLQTTATVGNRLLLISIAADGTNYNTFFNSGIVAASQDNNYLAGFNNITDDLAVQIFNISQGFPQMILPAGAIIRIYDSAAIDAAADDLTVVLHYVEYDV